MQVFFIKENIEKTFFKKIFKKVELKEDSIIINTLIADEKTKSKIKIVNNIKRLLDLNSVDTVIIEKRLKNDKEFMNLLYSKQIYIINGINLYKILLGNILKFELEKGKMKLEEISVAITLNNLNNWSENLIKKLSEKVKNLSIITNNINSFKKIQEDIYQKLGIVVTCTNNKRKALLKANIILNIDFPNEILNLYTINDNATIISIEENIKIHKKRFNGKIINNYEIKLEPNTEIDKYINQEKYRIFDIKDIVECYITIHKDEINNITII